MSNECQLTQNKANCSCPEKTASATAYAVNALRTTANAGTCRCA